VPRIRLLPGERNREFVPVWSDEKAYLRAAPQPLRDVAILILDTRLRIGEALPLERSNVHLQPVNGARFGYIQVRQSKSKKRNMPLTDRAQAMLAARLADTQSRYVFPSESGQPYLVTSLDHLHSEVRAKRQLPKDCVVHSLRHTYGTRLGEGRADAFMIMKLMGHSSVTVSQRYVHPSPETLEGAVERLQALNVGSRERLPEGPKLQLPATIIATSAEAASVSPVGPVAQLVRAADS
jgi:integrase